MVPFSFPHEDPPIQAFTNQIVCQAGPLKGQVFQVISTLTLGRDATCDIVLDDPKVSRLHGTLAREDNVVVFKDNNSTNGSLLNGKKVTGSVSLQLGDLLRLGACEFALLERTDFQSINIVGGETVITGLVETNAVNADALAGKIGKVFDYYKQHSEGVTKEESRELERIKRLFTGMRSIYTISQSLGKLLPLEQLLELIGSSLFKVFGSEIGRASCRERVYPRV